jgi:hypothetical protein
MSRMRFEPVTSGIKSTWFPFDVRRSVWRNLDVSETLWAAVSAQESAGRRVADVGVRKCTYVPSGSSCESQEHLSIAPAAPWLSGNVAGENRAKRGTLPRRLLLYAPSTSRSDIRNIALKLPDQLSYRQHTPHSRYISLICETLWSEWICSIHLILPAALGPGVHSASNRNESQKQKNVSWEVERGRCVGLTT